MSVITKVMGLHFTGDIPERNWKFYLTIDLSFQVPNGLFLQFLIRTPSDKDRPRGKLSKQDLLLGRSALAKIGLRSRRLRSLQGLCGPNGDKGGAYMQFDLNHSPLETNLAELMSRT